MKLSRNIALSCELLAAHKLRTLLSVTGIVVGIATVVLMVSAGRGAEKKILDRIRDMGTNLIVVNAGQTRIVAGRQRQTSMVTTLETVDAQAIASECESVKLAAPAVTKKLSIRREDENANTNVIGITPEGFRIRNIAIATGRMFDAEEDRARRRVAVLGPTAAVNLFGRTGLEKGTGPISRNGPEGASQKLDLSPFPDPVGLQIRIGRVPFEVIGLTESKGMDANGVDQDDLILVPLGSAMRRLFNVDYIDTIYVQAESAEALDRAEAEIRRLLRQRHRLRDKPDDFTIQNQATLLAAEREAAQSMSLLIGSVAAISLVVGGIGILAVMLIAVRERTPEIGLRRALGATRRDIRLQFLLESGLLAGSGGVIGVVGGVVAALAVSQFGYWEMILSWPAALAGFGFSVAVGLVFGIYPAVRAAALEPIEALRAE
jgi:putative ABC transport system permease protein